MPIVQALTRVLAHQTAYTSANASYVDARYPHSKLSKQMLKAVFDDAQLSFQHTPLFYVEAGCMYGYSLLKAFKISEKMNVNVEFVAIDPFTGDTNMWDWEERSAKKDEFRHLHLENGQPTIFERFLANTKVLRKHLIPIRTTSIVGFKLLGRLYTQKRLPYLPHIIYLDSAHELGETYIELQVAWNILQCNGILYGDDWDWPAIKHDVSRFVTDKKIPMFHGAKYLGSSTSDILFVSRTDKQWIVKKVC